jgi:hypothetical protein
VSVLQNAMCGVKWGIMALMCDEVKLKVNVKMEDTQVILQKSGVSV